MEKLQRKLAGNVPEDTEIPEKLTLGQAEKILLEWKHSLFQKEKGLKEDVQTLKRLQSRLQGIETEKSELRTAAESAAQKLTEAKALLASCQARRDSLDASREYETEAEARMALSEAKAGKKHAEQNCSAAEETSQKAKSDLENARTLIHRYHAELPGQKKECKERKNAYETAMKEKALTESQWKEQTETRDRTETVRLQEIIDTYNHSEIAREQERFGKKGNRPEKAACAGGTGSGERPGKRTSGYGSESTGERKSILPGRYGGLSVAETCYGRTKESHG